MSIPNGGEEKPLTLSELRALAEEYARQQDELADELASKARGRTNQARAKRREVSEEELLALGWRKADRGESTIPAAMRKALELKTRQTYEGNDIIFGPAGETQFVFRPSKGRVKGAARWTVGLLPVTTSRYDTQRELSKSGRKLWDLPHPGPLCWGIILRRHTRERLKEMGKPSVAYRAAQQLLACHVEKLQALHVEVRPLHELSERPKIEAVMEQLVKMSERLDTVNEQLLRAQAAIGLVVEVLYRGLGKKLKKAFDMLRDDRQWLEEVTNLRLNALALAGELQRPPTKGELRKRHGTLEEKDFTPLLEHAGLSWLEKGLFKIPTSREMKT